MCMLKNMLCELLNSICIASAEGSQLLCEVLMRTQAMDVVIGKQLASRLRTFVHRNLFDFPCHDEEPDLTPHNLIIEELLQTKAELNKYKDLHKPKASSKRIHVAGAHIYIDRLRQQTASIKHQLNNRVAFCHQPNNLEEASKMLVDLGKHIALDEEDMRKYCCERTLA